MGWWMGNGWKIKHFNDNRSIIFTRRFSRAASLNGGIKYLKYCIKIEKTTIYFLSSTQKEYICTKWLPFENLLGV